MWPSLPVRRRFLFGLAALALLGIARYGWAVGISFINDDFLFLERARRASFLDNWSFDDALGNVYRPLPRNLYFWAGLRLFGGDPTGYHVVNLGLVVLSLVLTALLARRLIAEAAGFRDRAQADGPALVAALVFALHPAAGTPASWVCGVQDLLAVDLALGALLAHLGGRRSLYLLLYAAAILSKETAAFLFLLAGFWDLAVARVGWRQAAARQLPPAALFGVWLLGNRWLPWNDLGSTIHSRDPGVPSLLGRFDLGTVALTLRALLLVQPFESFRWPYGPAATGAQLLLTAAVLALALAGRSGAEAAPPAGRGGTPARARGKPKTNEGKGRRPLFGLRRLVVFALLWILASVLPLVTVISHFVYYAYAPALGLSLLVAVLVLLLVSKGRASPAARRVPSVRLLTGPVRFLPLTLLAAVLLASAGLAYHASLCDAHNIRRASAHLHNFRADLRRLHPTFPESARIYFWNIPYWIGFQLADGPALRVWYADPTLTGHFLSAYEPDPRRPAFFFGHDDGMHLVEIVRGLPDPYLADPPPIFTLAHNDLGSTLAQAGEPEAGLVEWRKVLQVDPDFTAAAANLGIVLVRLGRFAEALPVLERSVKLEPEAADVRLSLANAYLQLGRHAEALGAFEVFLGLAPEARERARVEELVRELRAALARDS